MYDLNSSSRKMRALLTLAVVAASVAASAADLVDTHTFDLGALATTSWVKDVSLPKFDPLLGTLTGVSIYLEGQIQTNQEYINQSPTSPITMTGTSGARFRIKDSSNLITFATADATVSKTVTLNPSETKSFTNLTNSTTFSYSTSDSAALLAATGPGTFAFKISAAGLSDTSAVGQWDAHYSTLATGSGRVEYTYSPAAVPEPTSMAALGFGALAVLRRRSAKR
jgi:hypothetical protein